MEAAALDSMDEVSSSARQDKRRRTEMRDRAKDSHAYFLRGRRSVGPSPRHARSAA
jgi:hypothetical protein